MKSAVYHTYIHNTYMRVHKKGEFDLSCITTEVIHFIYVHFRHFIAKSYIMNMCNCEFQIKQEIKFAKLKLVHREVVW